MRIFSLDLIRAHQCRSIGRSVTFGHFCSIGSKRTREIQIGTSGFSRPFSGPTRGFTSRSQIPLDSFGRKTITVEPAVNPCSQHEQRVVDPEHFGLQAPHSCSTDKLTRKKEKNF
jgi:hypothetical protein